jgi:hypothetical protein
MIQEKMPHPLSFSDANTIIISKKSKFGESETNYKTETKMPFLS